MGKINLSDVNTQAGSAQPQRNGKRPPPERAPDLVMRGPIVAIPPPGRKLRHWLETYGEYTADSESPTSFHMWCGLGTIAGALQRKVYMESQHFEVLSNMFIVLVAPPGKVRKTTALNIGQKLLKEVPNVKFTTKATSPAALIQQFAAIQNPEHQSLTAYSHELGTFLSTNPAEMVDLATDLYDGAPDWEKQTIARGMEKITRPWFNFMAATTPQWLGDYLSATAVEGGFVSRTIFIYEDERILRQPFPQVTDEHKRLKKLLINDLTHISTLSGPVSLSEGAMKFYEEWYLDATRFPGIEDNRTRGYYERKHIHLLKVAMLLSIAESDARVIELHHLKDALAQLADIEPGMRKAFSAVGKNAYSTDIERMMDQFKRQGQMSYRQVIKQNFSNLDKRRMDEILEQLVSMGIITGNFTGGWTYTGD